MIEGPAKWGAFRACEAFALTSHSENFGIVVAEAMACGRPVLITDKVNVWREVEASGGGLVEPDTQEGADRLLRRALAFSPVEHRTMGERARACYDAHFRREGTAERLIALLRGEAL
jgi:glycosyltransferase involved in cell wall biosynthesis